MMEYAEDSYLPISALQHYVFCKRQCALIHIERLWEENCLTVEGRIIHENVHNAGSEARPNIRIVKALRISSKKIGLTGICDLIEFRSDERGVKVPGLSGSWIIYPVEYKRGRPKPDISDEVQLCAQAICLEEMLRAEIKEGSIYYGQPRRRHKVLFTPELQARTNDIALHTHELINSNKTPSAEHSSKCKSCSMIEQCMPKTIGSQKSVRRYISQMLSS